jgi:alanine racemase
MFSFLKKNSYKHLNKILVSKTTLLENHKILQAFHQESAICPVLKSNAYGHGLKLVSPIFDAMNCPFLIVDSLFEAYELKKIKVKTPILILGYINPINLTVKKVPFEIAIFDLSLAKILNKYQPGCRVHIFVDTGMSREGIKVNDLQKFLSVVKKLKNLKIVGLCSHFADADNKYSQEFTIRQIEQFKKALQIMADNNIFPKWRHISASSGAFKSHDKIFNMIRAGIAHYGINPLDRKDKYNDKISLKPALEFYSTLAQIKSISKGSAIGYGYTFTAKKNMTLALLPAGYYEGVDRRLSNKGFVKIRENFFPIVGRVSMNMTVIDISLLKHPRIGEEVKIYSANDLDKNSFVNSAALAETISYELLVHLAESVKRVIF